MHKNKKLSKAFAVILSAVLLFSASIVIAFAAPAQEAGTYRIDAALSCFISAMGGQEFGGVYDSAVMTKTDDGETFLTVNFKTTPMNIYTIQFDEFVDADDPATIGFYDADGVLHTAADENPIVTYTASEDTVAGPTNAQVPFSGERHYLTSMTFPISDDMNEITMWLYINSTVMGLQFSDGNGEASTNAPAQQTKYKGTLTLDRSSAKKVVPMDAALSCYISAMGGQEFGGVYDSSELLIDQAGQLYLTLYFKTTPMTIYTIQFDEFVDADDPATIGFYDADGVLHTAADENPIVTYTASEDTVAGPTNAQVPFSGERHYLTSMTFPITGEMKETSLWLYINSTVMGLQFCDGSGDASTNQPGVDTKYKSTLTFDVCEALGHSFTNYVSNDDATCTADGTKTAVCDRCDETDTVADEGTAKGHSFTNYVSNNDATCTADSTKTAICDRCDATDTVADEGTAKGHSFTNYVSNNDATCTADGTKTAVCDRCDTADTAADVGSARGHADADGNGFCDVCNTDLRDASKVCKYCNQIHTGFFGKIIGFIHSILAFFKTLFTK
mgnify:CR=1 FL=1